MAYQEEYFRSIQEKEVFWKEKAKKTHWFTFPEKILSTDEKGFYRWFQGGKLNTSYLALDHHIANGRGGQTALIYDSPVTLQVRKYTYNEALEHVSKLAGGLKSLGVSKGDRVIIYMPMIPEAVFSMLACARLGAVHSVVFGGFAPHELAVRIDDARPKVIITASAGIEIQKVIPYKPLVDKAIEEASFKPEHTLVLQRKELKDLKAAMSRKGDTDYDELLRNALPAGYVELDATDPLYILYTSGTTGKPKGIIRDNGGHAVALNYSMEAVYDIRPGEVYWAASDVGWVVGHSYICYAPFIRGCTTILYEGKPVKTPDAGAFWRVVAQHGVNIMFTAPTAIRAIKKEDPAGKLLKEYNLSSLRTLFLAGERCDVPTLEWIGELLNIPVIDHWWQTETGWAIVATAPGIEKGQQIKPGSPGKAVPGYEVCILDEEGRNLAANREGYIAIKLPLPPGCLPTLYNDDKRFVSSYLERFAGYYLTGDGGYMDEDGCFYVMGRVDDVINVAGHRLSTGEMEELAGSHFAVAECAVVGISDKLRGQVPVGLVVLKDNAVISEKELEHELVALIRDKIGPVACFKKVMQVKRLPKTRSGKILRRIIRNIADGEPYTVPSTIDDPVILTEICNVLKEHTVGTAFESVTG